MAVTPGLSTPGRYDHLAAGPEAVQEEQSSVTVVITVIHRNQVGDTVFLSRLQMA